MKRKFFMCECESHAVEIVTEDVPKDDTEDFFCISLSIWNQGIYNRSLWERIKLAWSALRDDLRGDNVSLSRLEANALGQYLVSEAKMPTNYTTSSATTVFWKADGTMKRYDNIG